MKQMVILSLIVSMLVGVFVGCGGQPVTPTVPTVTLSMEGENAYSIVTTSKKSNEKMAGNSLLKFLKANVFEEALIKTDAEDQPVSEYEIVVGKTTREETLTSFDRSTLKKGDFAIFFEGTRLFILGYNYEATAEGVEYFIDNYVTEEGEIKVPEGLYQVVSPTYTAENVTIGGQPLANFTIVYGSAPLAETVAKEMKNAIKTATGVTLEVVSHTTDATDCEILIGKTNRENDNALVDRKDLGTEGFVIEVVGTKLVITGGENEERGTAYGVYTFLEEYLGVLYLSEAITYYKPMGEVTLESGLSDRQTPYFELRNVQWDAYWGANISLKRKINGNGWPRDLSSVGGGWEFAGPISSHTIGQLAESDAHAQPCLTDEKVYNTVLKNVRLWLSQNPSAEAISVSQNDGGDFCECANCKALYTKHGCKMGAMLTFVNRIAAVVAEEYPGVYVETLAYTDTEQAPKDLLPADNVIIRLCPIYVSRLYGIGDERMMTDDDTKFMKAMEDWSKICDKLLIWDYTTNFAYQMAPQPNLKSMYSDASYYADHNVAGWFSQGWNYGNSADSADLKCYLLSKLMWDPYMSEEEYEGHIQDFYAGYYGAAGIYIAEYFDVLQALAEKNAKKVTYSSHPLLMYGSELEEKLEELNALITKAEKRVCYNSVYAASVNLLRMQYRYLWLGINFERMFYEGTAEEKQQIIDMNTEFKKDCIRLGLEVSEFGNMSNYNVRTSVFSWLGDVWVS